MAYKMIIIDGEIAKIEKIDDNAMDEIRSKTCAGFSNYGEHTISAYEIGNGVLIKLYNFEIVIANESKLYNKVLDYFNNNKDESISFEELRKEFQGEGIFLNDIIYELIENGEIYEPKEGVYKWL